MNMHLAEHMRNRCSRLKTRGLLGNKPLWVFHLHQSVDGVLDRYMNPLTFLYQTEFQLSSSSGNGRVEENLNSPASFCRSRYASLLRCPMRHAGNGNESLVSTGFIILGDVRAATPVELRMSNCTA
ncbi:hypothetical protein ATANTOWER_003517 [Ataeniobius toweri]|uniref:Uncharacterized protein n=1 Tax=Ataeniobius toweri TaxID=208326 RepID=A0ABU7BQ94_9TELE|nr:hypothetical protein [Ataeniobius toweri]